MDRHPARELLRAAGVKPSAVYTANYGADVHLSGDPKRVTLSRGVPVAKALSEHSLLVWAMNGQPLENMHGGPLRLIHPGWPGSTSHKWLSKITLRDKVHDGQGMLGASYRVAIKPMMPGGKADDSNFRILESMPVRSIITNPANGTRWRRARARCGCAVRPGRASSRCGVSTCRPISAPRGGRRAGTAEEPLRLAALDRDAAIPERRLL